MRRFVGVLVAGGLALMEAPAHAGTYEVVSCAATDGVNHAWHSFNEDPTTLGAGDSCASVTGGPADGLFVVDRIPGPPHTPAGRAAGWRLTAPAGVRITRLTTHRYLGQRSAGEWFPYLKTAEGTVLDTCTIPGGEDKCERGEPTYDPFGPVATFIINTSHLEAGVRCAEVAGTCGNGALLHAAWVALYATRVQVTDTAPPSMPAPAPPPSPSYARGALSFTVSASDTTGIRSTKLVVGDLARSTRDRACDYTYVVPCTNEPGAVHTLDTRQLGDGGHTVREVAEDGAGNETSRSIGITVDNTAPATPLKVKRRRPAGGRASSPRQQLVWTNPPGQVAPIAAAHWKLCRVAKTRRCVIGGRRGEFGAGGGQTGPLDRALPDGKWNARLWLEDAAGNADAATAATRRLVVKRRSPRLKIGTVTRRGNGVTVRGTTAARRGRVWVSIEHPVRGRTNRVSGRTLIRGGRWVRRLRLSGRLADARRAKLTVRFPVQHGYAGRTARQTVRWRRAR